MSDEQRQSHMQIQAEYDLLLDENKRLRHDNERLWAIRNAADDSGLLDVDPRIDDILQVMASAKPFSLEAVLARHNDGEDVSKISGFRFAAVVSDLMDIMQELMLENQVIKTAYGKINSTVTLKQKPGR